MTRAPELLQLQEAACRLGIAERELRARLVWAGGRLRVGNTWVLLGAAGADRLGDDRNSSDTARAT